MPRVLIVAEDRAAANDAAIVDSVAEALDRFFGQPTDAPVYWDEEGQRIASRDELESLLTDPHSRAVTFFDDDGQKITMRLDP